MNSVYRFEMHGQKGYDADEIEEGKDKGNKGVLRKSTNMIKR